MVKQGSGEHIRFGKKKKKEKKKKSSNQVMLGFIF